MIPPVVATAAREIVKEFPFLATAWVEFVVYPWTQPDGQATRGGWALLSCGPTRASLNRGH